MNGEPVKPRRGVGFWVAIGCTIAFIAFLAFVGFVFGIVVVAMRSSAPYHDAMERARNDPRVIAALGTPIEPGLFISGSVQTNNDTGTANLTIPIHGPKGKAKIRINGTKVDGKWNYSRMMVTRESGPPIDLLSSTEAPGSTNPPAS